MFSDLPPIEARAGHQAASSVATIEEAIAEYKAGRMVIVMDDEDRENEGDLCMAAEKVTPEAINFMATEGRGLICLPVTEQKLRELGLPMMVAENTAPLGTAFTVSIDARHGIGAGHLGARPRQDDPHRGRATAPRRATSARRATSSRCARATAASWCAPDRPRPRSTSRGSPGSSRPASSARS